MSNTLTLEEVEALEPSYLGPTWQRKRDGSWLLPTHTLGWQILGWTGEFLNNFDGTPNLRLTPEQARILLWWYAVDEAGSFIYRKGVLQRLKGHGKDPLLAVISVIEFVGPCRFGGWENGEPVAVPHPTAWVQVAAVSRDQTRNTMSLLPSIMSDRLRETYAIKAGEELIRANHGRCRLEAVTSSFRALEGGRSTFVVLNETQHWVSGNSGHKMYETIDGNATKMKSRYLAITNAYLPGEDSVAERMREAWEKIRDGRAVDVGFLYDSIEAHEKTPLTPDALRIVLPKIRGDADWLDVEQIIKSVLDQTIAPSRSRRMFLNQIVAEEDALYSPGQWDALLDEDATLREGDEIVLGFDGGKTDDGTALVALRISDMCAFLIEWWARPEELPADVRWEVPRDKVDEKVRETHRLYTVRGFYADVYPWESYIDDWSDEYKDQYAVKSNERSAIGWDMRQSAQRVTLAHERLMRSIWDGKLKQAGDRIMRWNVLNARRRSNNYGVSFGKESRESPRKVDAYAALMLAFECLHDLRTRGKQQKQRTGRGYFL